MGEAHSVTNLHLFKTAHALSEHLASLILHSYSSVFLSVLEVPPYVFTNSPTCSKLFSPSMLFISVSSLSLLIQHTPSHSTISLLQSRALTLYHSFHTFTMPLSISITPLLSSPHFIPLPLSLPHSFTCLSAIFHKLIYWQLTPSHSSPSFGSSSLRYPAQPLISPSIITFHLFILSLFPVLFVNSSSPLSF